MLDALTDQHVFKPAPASQRALMSIRDLNLWYGDKQALKNVTFDLNTPEILAFIGPSGCGKSTALKVLNRMHDDTRGVRITGSVTMDGADVYAPDIDPPMHRRRFGWVAQKPNPFAMTIFENVAYAARLHGLAANRADLHDTVESCMRRSLLWDEVKDKLKTQSGHELSGGQQQRLCIARALATNPDVLLMDEPTGSVDPVATAKLEELMVDIGQTHAIVIVTHSMMEARRIADRVAYFHLGALLELGSTDAVFTSPKMPETKRFISGAVG